MIYEEPLVSYRMPKRDSIKYGQFDIQVILSD
jgi:hypothetical protein